MFGLKVFYNNAKKLFHPGSWQVGSFLLVNTALGAGVLNYPAAYDRLGGVAIATLLQVLVILLMSSTMLILVLSAKVHSVGTYHDVLNCMGGKLVRQLSAASIMLSCFGINVTYLIVVGDQFDRIFYTFISADFCHTFWLSRTFTILACAICLTWPICYFKRIDFLRYVSTLGIFAMLYVIFLNVYEFYMLDVIPGEIRTKPVSAIELIGSLPVVCFAYQSHEMVLPVYSSLSTPQVTNFVKSTVGALCLMAFIYMTGGTYGYLTFGSHIKPDIVQMYDASDPVVVIGIVALIIKMISSYTCLMFCGRQALDGLYTEIRRLSPEAQLKSDRTRRIIETTCWNIAVLTLALVTPNITIAIELLGSLAACTVFIFPGLCMLSLAHRHLTGYYIKVNNDRRLLQAMEGTTRWRYAWYSLLAYGVWIIFFGCAICVLVLVQVVNDIRTVNDAHHLLCKL